MILIRTPLITTDTWNDYLEGRYHQRSRRVRNLMGRQRKDFESKSERIKLKFGAWNEKYDSYPADFYCMSMCFLPRRMLGQ